MSISILPSQDATLFDSQYSNPTDSGQGKSLLWIIVGLSLVGLLISGYLTWTTLTSASVAGCSGDGAGCSHVLTSVWSKWLGMPVSLFGLLTYVGILAATFFTTRDNQSWGPTLLLTLTLTAAGSAAWFIGLQFVAIGHICLWCMAVHCCSLLVCTLTIIYLFVGGNQVSQQQQMSAFFGGAVQPEVQYEEEAIGPNVSPILASAIASAGLVVLMAGQFFFQPSGLQYEEVASVAPEQDSLATETPATQVTQPAATDSTSVSEENELPVDGSQSDADLFEEPDGGIQQSSSFAEEPTSAQNTVEQNDIYASDDSEALDDEEFLASLTDDKNEETSTKEDPLFGPEEPDTGEVVPAEMIEDTSDKPAPSIFGSRNKPEKRLVSFASLREPIDVSSSPILGRPDAEHVLVEMLDYTCPHCRNLHPHVVSSLERYGNQVAFVIVHVPLSKKCNPYVKRDHWSHKNACDYARLSLSVWKLDRSKFVEFHSWLMEGERPPSNIEARRYAMELVGEEVLLSENLKSETLSSFAGNSDTMMRMNAGLPLILTPKGKVSGIPTNERDWFNFLETRIGLKPVE